MTYSVVNLPAPFLSPVLSVEILYVQYLLHPLSLCYTNAALIRSPSNYTTGHSSRTLPHQFASPLAFSLQIYDELALRDLTDCAREHLDCHYARRNPSPH